MKNKGFTLIELLVVVAIIGILAAVGVVAYSGYTKGAKKSAVLANHKSIVKDLNCFTLVPCAYHITWIVFHNSFIEVS